MIAKLGDGAHPRRAAEACRVEEYRVVDRQFGFPASQDRRKEGDGEQKGEQKGKRKGD
ncbi:hypothetical protein ACIP3B_02255 [Streptomyces anulatus]|uniref:hypothetical protein n=1 Tax=Streptomyces TaxID=1883 RepID=UPI001E2EDD14|nr:hypothetical protein [Streptomyces sp. DH7]